MKHRFITEAQLHNTLFVSILSFWKVGLITHKKRLHFSKPMKAWRHSLLESGLQEVAVSDRVARYALTIPPYHSDPIDCFRGTAMAHDMVLLTSDEDILNWSGELQRQDAYK